MRDENLLNKLFILFYYIEIIDANAKIINVLELIQKQ